MSIAVYPTGSTSPVSDPASISAFTAALSRELAPAGPLRPTLVFFGGYRAGRGGGGAGVTTWEVDGRGLTLSPSRRALQQIEGLFRSPGRVLDYDPDCAPYGAATPTIERALGELSDGGLDPRAPLVVYGYSSGGYNAVGLCQALSGHLGWYSFRRRRLGSLAGPPTEADCREGGSLRVDLLVTVDASIRRYEEAHLPAGERVDLPRAPRPLVKAHLNFFQATAGEVYHGTKQPSADNREQQVEGVNHHDIPTHGLVAAAVYRAVRDLVQPARAARAA